MHSQHLFSSQTKKEEAISFTIIGMGITGNSLFCQLVEKLIENNPYSSVTIDVFEENPAFFLTGFAYQLNAPTIWTLNNLAEKFNLLPSGDNVAVWMQKNPDKWRPFFSDIDENYVPRALVGLYLKDHYERYKKMAGEHGIQVKEHFCKVIDACPISEKRWQITIQDQRQHQTDFLFLCLGSVAANHFPHLQAKPNYFHSSHGVETLKTIPKEASICILGGQATFVDIALWLAYVNQHVGDIYTVTRSRPIITTKGNKDECDKAPIDKLVKKLAHYPILTLSLAQSKHLLWKAYQKAAKNPLDISNLPSTKDTLTYQLSKYDSLPLPDIKGNIDELRAFIFTFYNSDCYHQLWEKLREEDQREFTNQLSSTIFAYLTGITPLNARLLLELYNRETIKEHFGLTHITYNENEKIFNLHFKDGSTKEATYLIDATGVGYNLNANLEQFPLVKCLVEKGFIMPRPSGGLYTNDSGQAFNKENYAQENLFYIGPVASYGHKFPTPYASFIATKAVENAVKSLPFPIETKQVYSNTLAN